MRTCAPTSPASTHFRSTRRRAVACPSAAWPPGAARGARAGAGLGCSLVAGFFMLLVVAFRRTRDAVIVMVNLPLALIGGIAGVYLAGGILSVASIIGFITLFGIATRNGIMLVSHIQHVIEKEGETDFRAAVERASHERLPPPLVTPPPGRA